MITNVIAALLVTFNTNTVDRFPVHDEVTIKRNDIGALQFYHQEVLNQNPTNKWVETVVTRKLNTSFMFEGRLYIHNVVNEVIDESKTEWVLSQTWHPKSQDLVINTANWPLVVVTNCLVSASAWNQCEPWLQFNTLNGDRVIVSDTDVEFNHYPPVPDYWVRCDVAISNSSPRDIAVVFPNMKPSFGVIPPFEWAMVKILQGPTTNRASFHIME